IDLRLLAATAEDAFEIDLIRAVFRHFLGAACRELDELARDVVGALVLLVEGPLSFAPRLQQAGFLQQPEVRRYPRLAQAGDLLQFVDGKLLAVEQRNNAQARRIGEGAKRFQGGGHDSFVKIRVDAPPYVYIFKS